MGSPPVVLRGLTLSGFTLTPAIAVAGGSLRAEDCRFVDNAASAVLVTGGTVEVEGATFERNSAPSGGGGGAMRLHGGHTDVSRSTFLANAAREGGALHVRDAGHVWLRSTQFRRNAAAVRGGAIFASNSSVTLTDQSIIDDSNRAAAAGDGHATYADVAAAGGAAITYALPAPSGYWIANPVQCRAGEALPACQQGLHTDRVVWSLPSAGDQALPFKCSPGFLGSNATDAGTQQSPQCAGYCPAGFYCLGGATGQIECPRGHYCPAGVPAGVPCRAGTYNDQLGQSSDAACVVCPPGYYCGAAESYRQACPPNTYNSLPGEVDSSSCTPCPGVAITDGPASTSRAQCTCPPEFFADGDGFDDGSIEVRDEAYVGCVACVTGTNCTQSGSTLLALRLDQGHYRHTNRSLDVRSCPDAARGCAAAQSCQRSMSGCLGGGAVADASCRAGLTGIYCQLCSSWLQDDATSAQLEFYVAATDTHPAHCAPCESRLLENRSFAAVLAVTGALALCLISCYAPLQTKIARLRERCRKVAERYSVKVKVRVVIGFYQIATQLDDAYILRLPGSVRDLLSSFKVAITFGLGGLPLSCFSAPGYLSRLAFWMVAPLVVIAAAVAASASFDACRARLLRIVTGSSEGRSSVRAAARDGRLLPTTLRVLFLAYPTVTNVAFEGFSCLELDAGEEHASRWLQADLSVPCDLERIAPWAVLPHLRTSKYAQCVLLAWLAVLLYPIGVLVLNGVLLSRAHRAIRSGHPTPLSRSTAFLHGDYRKMFFFWELAEVSRRLLLVGLFTVGPYLKGSTMQVALATLVSMLYLVVQLVAMPYTCISDNFLALVSSLGLALFFITALLFKQATLTEVEEIAIKMSDELKHMHIVEFPALTAVLFACSLSAVIAIAVIVHAQFLEEQMRQRFEERAKLARRLRHTASGKEVVAPPIGEDHYHVFLSHVWGTGQDQMRVIRQRLQEMVPGMRAFLDVEDLEDISDLEGYIKRSKCVVVYCSRGYFESKNCMIELRAAVKLGKHIQPLMDLEASRGGLTRDEVCNQILAADAHYAKWGFVDGPRGAELCAKLFERQPIEWNRIGAFQDVTMRMIAAGALGEENAPGLATRSSSRIMRRSKSRRSGGLDAAELAEATYLEQETAHKSVELPPPEVTGRTFHCFISSSNPGAVELLEEVALKMKMEIKTTTDIADLPACGHMLVYLTGETWTGGARSDSLALDVNAAMDAGTHLLLAHEMPGMQDDGQDARHGVEFSTFFACSDGATPTNLIQANIYGQIAVALKGGPWRVASMVLMAQGIASGMEVEPLSLLAASSLAVLKAAFKLAPRPRPKEQAVPYSQCERLPAAPEGNRREVRQEEGATTPQSATIATVVNAQGVQLTGTLYKRSPTTGMYKKVEVVIEGTTLCCSTSVALPSALPPVVLSVSNVERLKVDNRARLEFSLLTKKSGPERGRTYAFRARTCANAYA